MNKAKTASKNNPDSRSAAKAIKYNGREVVPVKVIDSSTYMSAQYKDNAELITVGGQPIKWRNIIR